jgi:hypothetical protein
MKINSLLLITLLVLLILPSFSDNPCQKKKSSRNNPNRLIVITYPNCIDSTSYISRTYENEKLIGECVVSENKLVSKTNFSTERANAISSQMFFEDNKAKFLYTYYDYPTVTKSCVKYESDTSSFVIDYYQNGNIKEYGHYSNSYCPKGQFVEFDSLGVYRWIGSYHLVNKRTIEKADFGKIELVTCSEKDGIWYQLNRLDQKTDSAFYVGGEKVNPH